MNSARMKQITTRDELLDKQIEQMNRNEPVEGFILKKLEKSEARPLGKQMPQTARQVVNNVFGTPQIAPKPKLRVRKSVDVSEEREAILAGDRQKKDDAAEMMANQPNMLEQMANHENPYHKPEKIVTRRRSFAIRYANTKNDDVVKGFLGMGLHEKGHPRTGRGIRPTEPFEAEFLPPVHRNFGRRHIPSIYVKKD